MVMTMVTVEKLSKSLHSLLELLVSKRARYIAKYTLNKDEGFLLHYHSGVHEYIILMKGSFALRFGAEGNSIKEQKFDTKRSTIFIDVPRETMHALIGLTDNSSYIVVKEFDDAMKFT